MMRNLVLMALFLILLILILLGTSVNNDLDFFLEIFCLKAKKICDFLWFLMKWKLFLVLQMQNLLVFRLKENLAFLTFDGMDFSTVPEEIYFECLELIGQNKFLAAIDLLFLFLIKNLLVENKSIIKGC